MFRQNVRLHIHAVAGLQVAQVGEGPRVGNYAHGETVFLDVGHGQADAVEGDGAFGHHIPAQMVGKGKGELMGLIA